MATGHTDPQRRARILAAALDLIAEEGVAGVSHRKIAARARVPLGSMTYHFTGIDDLLLQAFTGYADHVATLFEDRLTGATTADEAREAVTDLVHTLSETPRRDLVLTQELHTLTVRHEPYHALCVHWMRRSRTLLEHRFPPPTARRLDALVKGLTLHRALDDTPSDRELTREAIARITAGP